MLNQLQITIAKARLLRDMKKGRMQLPAKDVRYNMRRNGVWVYMCSSEWFDGERWNAVPAHFGVVWAVRAGRIVEGEHDAQKGKPGR